MNNSQIVRQRLSTVVTVRSQQQQPNANAGVTPNANNPNNPLRRNMTSPLDPLGSGGGSMVDNNANNGNPMMNQSQQQQQMSGNMMSGASELDSSMRFLDMPQGEFQVFNNDFTCFLYGRSTCCTKFIDFLSEISSFVVVYNSFVQRHHISYHVKK